MSKNADKLNRRFVEAKTRVSFRLRTFIFLLAAGCVCQLWITVSYASAQKGKSLEFYVAADGNDVNSGSIEKPFATIGSAQQAVREINKKSSGTDIVVNIRGGNYLLNDVLKFYPEDGGGSDYSVTYRAYMDENVIVSGGRKIERWVSDGENLWYAVLPNVKSGDWWFRDLFADGRRCIRARFPNSGQMLRILNIRETKVGELLARQTFTFDQKVPVSNLAGRESEMVTFHIWSISRTPVMNSIENEVSTFYPVGWIGHNWTLAQKDRFAYLENAFEFIDVSGEWYLDRDAGRVYYKAAEGENPNTMKFTAPYLDSIMIIGGTDRDPVRNLHFKNITFENSGWQMPLGGYNGIQAGVYGFRYVDDPTYCLTPSVLCKYAQGIVFDSCHFAHTGSSGLAFGKGAHRNRIQECEFYDIGGTAIQVGWCEKVDDPPRQLFENDWKNSADAPQDNQILCNKIDRCATVQIDCTGIFVAFSGGTKVLQNQISNLPYTGISLGYCWHEQKTTQRRTEVAYNHIHNVMQQLDDGGAIYTIGYQPGTQIHHNLVHDIIHGHGYYADECSSHILVENNIFYNLGQDGMFLKGHHNTIRNNIISKPKRFCVFSSIPIYDGGGFRTDLIGSERESSFLLLQNILLIGEGGQYFGGQWNDPQHVRLNNLGWNISKGGDSPDALPSGSEKGLTIEDPRIVDIERGDYTLDENSPAYDIGFQKIDLKDN